MMLPTLISVSDAPVSYFFCADAAVDRVAASARAAEKAPNRIWKAGILISLDPLNVSRFFGWERRLRRSDTHSIPIPGGQQEQRLQPCCRKQRDFVESPRNIPLREVSFDFMAR